MQLNYTPHVINLVEEGCPDVVDDVAPYIIDTIPSSGSGRLTMTDLGNGVVEYGRPEGLPVRPAPNTTYIVALSVALQLLALGWPSEALRVPQDDIRLTNGTRAGAARRLVQPRLAR